MPHSYVNIYEWKAGLFLYMRNLVRYFLLYGLSFTRSMFFLLWMNDSTYARKSCRERIYSILLFSPTFFFFFFPFFGDGLNFRCLWTKIITVYRNLLHILIIPTFTAMSPCTFTRQSTYFVIYRDVLLYLS